MFNETIIKIKNKVFINKELNEEVPSKVLSRILKTKQSQNNIFQIKDKNGNMKYNNKEILICFIDYYKELFKESNYDKNSLNKILKNFQIKINEEEIKLLDKEITSKDIFYIPL